MCMSHMAFEMTGIHKTLYEHHATEGHSILNFLIPYYQ